MNDSAAIKTYRYLRISMVGVVVLLAVSIAIEVDAASCWQTSVSAYYYTPVGAIFVGMLMTIGLCLIVIKGSTAWEDATLNAAGMLAPVVALVPTTDVGPCTSEVVSLEPLVDGELAPWVVANIDNNISALLVAGIVGLLVAAVIASIATRNVKAVAEVGTLGTRLGLLAAMVFLLLGLALFIWWDGFDERAHGLAAVLMFLFLALAVGGNAWEHRNDQGSRVYAVVYGVIAVAMVLAGVVLLPMQSSWAYTILLLEGIEIALFAAFWLVQTYEHWNDTA